MATKLSKGAYAALIEARWAAARALLASNGSLPVLVIGALPGPTPDTTTYTYLPAPEIVYNLPAILRDLADQCERGSLQGTPPIATLPDHKVTNATDSNGSDDNQKSAPVPQAARVVDEPADTPA